MDGITDGSSTQSAGPTGSAGSTSPPTGAPSSSSPSSAVTSPASAGSAPAADASSSAPEAQPGSDSGSVSSQQSSSTPAAGHAAGTPNDSAGKGQSASKSSVRRYDISKQERGAAKDLEAAKGNTDPRIVSDAARVQADLEVLRGKPGPVAKAIDAVVKARAAYAQPRTVLKDALDRVGGVLKATTGGAQFYANTRGNSVLERAENVVERMPAGGLKVPAELISALGEALLGAKAAKKVVEDAVEVRSQAIADFTEAKTQLYRDRVILRASLRWYGHKAKSAKATQSVAARVQSTALTVTNGTGSANHAVAKSRTNGHRNGAQHA